MRRSPKAPSLNPAEVHADVDAREQTLVTLKERDALALDQTMRYLLAQARLLRRQQYLHDHPPRQERP